MPEIKAEQILIKVHQRYPKIIKVMLTGQADGAALQRAVQDADLYCFLYKQWKKKDLIETIKPWLAKL
jgi:DNA-binding NtrC family response regulator